MNTEGEYNAWYFTNDWNDVYRTTYIDGLYFEDWIKDNNWLLDEIDNKFSDCKNKIQLAENIYDAINAQDFRPGSCGGCI